MVSDPALTPTTNPASILDFDQAAGDRIDLSAIDAIPGGADDPFTFLAGGACNGTPGKVISIALGGNNYRVEGDIDGNNVADFAILVTSVVLLDAGSFIL